MEFFYKKHIPVLRIKVHGLMILIVRYFFSHDLSHSWAVLIGYLGKKSFVLNKQKTDKAGKVLILYITIDAKQYLIINMYNANTETDQVKILEDLVKKLFQKWDISQNERIIFAGDFNIFFNSKLKAKGGKSLLKIKSIAKLVEKKETLDIWISG